MGVGRAILKVVGCNTYNGDVVGAQRHAAGSVLLVGNLKAKA